MQALANAGRHVYDNAWCFGGVIALLMAPMFAFDLDYFSWLSSVDAAHESWMIDQVVTLVSVLVLAFLVRQNHRLRREAIRRKTSEAVAVRLARTDSLTGLMSRRGLFELLDDRLERLRLGEGFAVMMIDLDQFKAINDRHGHTVGDDVLRAAVARMTSALDGAALARLGGDEFVAVLGPDVNRSRVGRTADRVLAQLARPIHIGEEEIDLGASIGIALALDDGATPSALLQAADTALARAKSARRGTCRFFEPAMDAAIRERTALKADLRRAIERGQIAPYYQSIVDLGTGEVCGVEVLARWLHPLRGMVDPTTFIPMVEDIGLLTPMTVALLRQVGRDAAGWPVRLRISINLSPAQLLEPDLAATLLTVIEDAELAPSRFEIEVTESALVGDIEGARAALEQFRRIGMRVALDDFGTGHSGLSQLRDFRLDRVKMDKSFVRGVATDPEAARYVEAIAGLLLGLGLPVTAEGIEDTATRDTLRAIGCALGQGYLFGRPVPAAQLRFDPVSA